MKRKIENVSELYPLIKGNTMRYQCLRNQELTVSKIICLCVMQMLTLKAPPIKTAADNIHKYFFHCFSEKIRLDVSSESSASLIFFER